MKSKETTPYSNFQPWRIVLRHKASLQEIIVLAFGRSVAVASSHYRSYFKPSDFELVQIYPITKDDVVALAVFSDPYANPLISSSYEN